MTRGASVSRAMMHCTREEYAGHEGRPSGEEGKGHTDLSVGLFESVRQVEGGSSSSDPASIEPFDTMESNVVVALTFSSL